MKKILITALEPFGISGMIRGENASLSVAKRLAARLPDQVDLLTLPVSHDADSLLYNRLIQDRPPAVLCLGEDLALLPNTVLVEPYATDVEATFNPFAGAGQPKLVSTFAQTAFPDRKKSAALAYFCNAVHRRALKWSAEESGHPPVAFAHVAVLGRRDLQAEKTAQIFQKLQQAAIPGFSPQVAP